jgi:hypothetical protein
MAMKKTAKPIRPGQGQPGGPPNPSRVKVSSGLTVLGKVNPKSIAGNRTPLSNAQMAELKKMIAKAEADKKAVAKSSKKDAKIVKKQNKKPLVTGRGATKPVTKETIGAKKKPVVKVTPRGGGMRGGGMGFGGGGGLRGNVNR